MSAAPETARRVPFPNVEVWFIGVEPLADAGSCDHCAAYPSVVVDGERYVCVGHVGQAVSAAADEHAVGYQVVVDCFEEPLPQMPPSVYIDLTTGEMM